MVLSGRHYTSITIPRELNKCSVSDGERPGDTSAEFLFFGLLLLLSGEEICTFYRDNSPQGAIRSCASRHLNFIRTTLLVKLLECGIAKKLKQCSDLPLSISFFSSVSSSRPPQSYEGGIKKKKNPHRTSPPSQIFEGERKFARLNLRARNISFGMLQIAPALLPSRDDAPEAPQAAPLAILARPGTAILPDLP